jgi:hypothetical protein
VSEWGFAVNDIKQSHDPNSLAYYAPPGSQDAQAAASRQDNGESQQRRTDEPIPRLRVVEANKTRTVKDAPDDPFTADDAFTAAVATAMRQQIEAELMDSSWQHRRKSFPALATLAIVIAAAAAAALTYVVLFPPTQQSTSEQQGWAPARLFTATQPRRPPPTLLVRNQSGTVNEPLELGIVIDRAEPGSAVIVKGLPVGTRLAAGEQLSPVEWRVPAENATDAVVIPPADFTGEVKLLAELRSADGAALVSAIVQLAWKVPPPPVVPVAAAPAAPPAAAPPAPEPAPPARVEAAKDPAVHDEVGALIRRAQDILATGNVKGARALLLRAVDAHDPRAAYALAQTYDPTVSRQSGTADANSDLALSRSWYQRAREWGAPEAQQQLDALATLRQ